MTAACKPRTDADGDNGVRMSNMQTLWTMNWLGGS